jgi:transcriptional regulator with XRE-family HTH domain
MLRVKEYRLNRGLRQDWVAKQAGISVASLTKIENGKQMPGADTLKKIAEVLNCTMDELIA